MTNRELIELKITKQLLPESSYSQDSFFEIYRRGIKDIFSSLTGKSLEFHFTVESELNAYAFTVLGTPVICISTGLFTGIFDYIYRLCENPNFFPHFGNPVDSKTYIEERAKPNINGDKIIYSTSLFHNLERLGFANMISNLAIWFILLHEVGHHIEGHLSYLYETQDISFLAMKENQIGTSESSKYHERQCIEMFADFFAGTSLSGYVISNHDGNDLLAGFADTLEKRITILNSAITILFSFLDDLFVFKDLNDFKRQYYLPTNFRNSLFLNNVFQYLVKNRFNISQDEYHASIQQMRSGVSLSISDTFSFSKVNIVDFIVTIGNIEILMEHYNMIFLASNDLKTKLLNYSLINLSEIIPPVHILNGFFGNNNGLKKGIKNG
jgi:hypothetical protein